MDSPLKRALTIAVGAFFVSLFIGWFLSLLTLWDLFSSWGQLFLFSLLVASLAALFTWIRSHIRSLHERINLLSLEIDKLKKS